MVVVIICDICKKPIIENISYIATRIYPKGTVHYSHYREDFCASCYKDMLEKTKMQATRTGD
jgi:hypothetical protein